MQKRKLCSLLSGLVFVVASQIPFTSSHAIDIGSYITTNQTLSGDTVWGSVQINENVQINGGGYDLKTSSSGCVYVLNVLPGASITNVKNLTISAGSQAANNQGTIIVSDTLKVNSIKNSGLIEANQLDLSSGAGIGFTNESGGKLILETGVIGTPTTSGGWSGIANNGELIVKDGVLQTFAIVIGENGTLTDGNGGWVSVKANIGGSPSPYLTNNSTNLVLKSLETNYLRGTGNLTVNGDAYISNYELSENTSFTGKGTTTIYQGTLKENAEFQGKQLIVGQLMINGKISLEDPLILSGSIKETGHTSIQVNNGGGENFAVKNIVIDNSKSSGYIALKNGTYDIESLTLKGGTDSGYTYTGLQNFNATVNIGTVSVAENTKALMNAYKFSGDEKALTNVGTLNVATSGELYLNTQTNGGTDPRENAIFTFETANFADGSSITEKDVDNPAKNVGTHVIFKTLNASGMNVKQENIKEDSLIEIGQVNFLAGTNEFTRPISGYQAEGSDRSTLSIVVNEGAKASFSALTANDLNVTLNTLAENSLQSAQTHADNVVVTVNSELNAGETSAVIAAAQAAVSLGQVDPVATASEGTYKVIIEEGVINPGVTINYADPNDPSSAQTVVVTPNRKIAAYSGMVAATTMAWIGQMNDLYKRMGNLRDSAGDTGLWSRVYQYKNKYQSGDIKSKNTALQIGADHRLGDWIVGGAFSYTDGNMNYSGGSGDMKNYGFAAYGSWLGPNGLFADVIGKYTRMETKFNADGMNGKVHNNAVNLSAEAGWKVDLTEQFFVEPQAELSLGRVNGKDIKAGNGVSVHQDNFSAVVGRVGLRSGFNLPQNKGQVYARASILHNWDSKVTGTATAAGSTAKIREDLSGTYYEMGLGAQFNFNKNAYMYADVERQAGGAVKEPWRWNVGVRYSF